MSVIGKKRIEETKSLMESWNSHLIEQGGGLQGLNRTKVAQLLKRLAGGDVPSEYEVGDEDIIGSEDLPGGDGPNDAMPADGKDDDAVVDDVDSIGDEDKLSMGDVMVVLNQLRNTGGLSFENMGNKMLDQVRDAVQKTVSVLEKRPGVSSLDKESDKKNITTVGNRILNRLEAAFEKLFEPKTLLNIQEVLDCIKKEEKRILSESRNKLTITIRG